MAVVAAGSVALFLGAAALSSAQTVYVEVGPIKTSFSASIKPKALPKSTRAPIAVRLSSTVVAKGGGQIPAIARAKIGIDRSLTIDARGVPACSARPARKPDHRRGGKRPAPRQSSAAAR